MATSKKPQEKSRLHPRNKNRDRYDLNALIIANPYLKAFVKPNKHGADYIHYLADLLCEYNFGRNPNGAKIKCLDVGVGANCIYPILGATEYNWNFIGSDIDPQSITTAEEIVKSNPSLVGKIKCKLQNDPKAIFRGIIGSKDIVDLTLCNPPFHESEEAAQKGSLRKVQNLSGKKIKTAALNFSGVSKELIFEGGEVKFISNMVLQSKTFANNCFWFTTLVSKQSNLKAIYKVIDQVGAFEVKTIPMGTGNKVTRIVAWTFLSKIKQNEWCKKRWK